MKTISLLALASGLAVSVLAGTPAPKHAAPAAEAKDQPAGPVMSAADAKLTAPLVLKDGAISQPAQTELTEGGKAVFTFSVKETGNYVIHAVVNAPAEDANSFFLNIDAPPEDPLMIWDMEVTTGFQERVVSWRGTGDANYDEFSPKVFKLTAGEHKLCVVGREPTFLKSLSIRAAAVK